VTKVIIKTKIHLTKENGEVTLSEEVQDVQRDYLAEIKSKIFERAQKQETFTLAYYKKDKNE
jgi:hypothetical protein